MESVTRAAVYVTKAGQVTAATSWHVTLGAAYMASATTEPVSACKAGTADTALSVSRNDVFFMYLLYFFVFLSILCIFFVFLCILMTYVFYVSFLFLCILNIFYVFCRLLCTL